MEEGYNDQSNGVTTISWTLQNIWVFKISDVPLEDQVGFLSGWSVSVSLAIPLLKKIVIDSPKNIQMHSGAIKTRILHILLLLKQRYWVRCYWVFVLLGGQDLNAWPLRWRCMAIPTELWRPIYHPLATYLCPQCLPSQRSPPRIQVSVILIEHENCQVAHAHTGTDRCRGGTKLVSVEREKLNVLC